MSTKAALKSIRNKLQDSEPEGALYEATNLLKSLPEDGPDAPNVYVLPLHVQPLTDTQLGVSRSSSGASRPL